MKIRTARSLIGSLVSAYGPDRVREMIAQYCASLTAEDWRELLPKSKLDALRPGEKS
jgi:hypothetical protein